jgi:hypothetical protein
LQSFPLREEGSGAPTGAGCIGTRLERTNNVGPRVPAQGGFHRVCAPGDARLSALHRGGLLASGPPGPDLGALHMSGAPQSSQTAFAGPARSSGWAVLPEGLPGDWLHDQTRGTPRPILLKQCLAISTLGGRDATKIRRGNRPSNVFRRYHQNAYDNARAKCGARQQDAAASMVFAVALSQTVFGSLTRMVLAKALHRLQHAHRKSTAEISSSVNRSG